MKITTKKSLFFYIASMILLAKLLAIKFLTKLVPSSSLAVSEMKN